MINISMDFGMKYIDKLWGFFNNKKYQEILRGRLLEVFREYEKEFGKILKDMAFYMKDRLSEFGGSDETFDKMYKKFEITLENEGIEKTGDILEESFNTPSMIQLWNMLVNDDFQKLNKKIEDNISMFMKIYFREANKYFNSKEVDIELLKREKNEVLPLLGNSIQEFDLWIFRRGIALSKSFREMSGGTLGTAQIEGFEKIKKEIEAGSLQKYNDRLTKVLDKILTAFISKIEK